MGEAATVAKSPALGAEARQLLGESVPMTPKHLPGLGLCRAACWVLQADTTPTPTATHPIPSLTHHLLALQMLDLLSLESLLIPRGPHMPDLMPPPHFCSGGFPTQNNSLPPFSLPDLSLRGFL